MNEKQRLLGLVITPTEVAKAIDEAIDLSDKIICDIGCGEGDFMLELSKYAKKVIGIEESHLMWERAKAKGLDVILGDAKTISIPKADVYYLWLGPEIKEIAERLNGIVIHGDYMENGDKADFVESLGGEEIDITYKNNFKITIVK